MLTGRGRLDGLRHPRLPRPRLPAAHADDVPAVRRRRRRSAATTGRATTSAGGTCTAPIPTRATGRWPRWRSAASSPGVITQNVDLLHEDAGSRHVIDLHGRYDRVVCLACGTVIPRAELADRLDALNPGFVESRRLGRGHRDRARTPTPSSSRPRTSSSPTASAAAACSSRTSSTSARTCPEERVRAGVRDGRRRRRAAGRRLVADRACPGCGSCGTRRRRASRSSSSTGARPAATRSRRSRARRDVRGAHHVRRDAAGAGRGLSRAGRPRRSAAASARVSGARRRTRAAARPHSASRTPPTTSTRWLSRRSRTTSHCDPHAPALGSHAPEHEPRDARQHGRARAHEARLQGHDERAVVEPPPPERRRRRPQREDLGVRGRVAVGLARVPAAARRPRRPARRRPRPPARRRSAGRAAPRRGRRPSSARRRRSRARGHPAHPGAPTGSLAATASSGRGAPAGR